MTNFTQNISIQFVPMTSADAYDKIDEIIAVITGSGLKHVVTAFSTQAEGKSSELLQLVNAVTLKAKELDVKEYLINFQFHAHNEKDIFLEDKTEKHES